MKMSLIAWAAKFTRPATTLPLTPSWKTTQSSYKHLSQLIKKPCNHTFHKQTIKSKQLPLTDAYYLLSWIVGLSYLANYFHFDTDICKCSKNQCY